LKSFVVAAVAVAAIEFDDCYKLSYRSRLIHYGSRKFHIEHFLVVVTLSSHDQHAHNPHNQPMDEVNVRSHNLSCYNRQRSFSMYHRL
jgi:hypothetical protein